MGDVAAALAAAPLLVLMLDTCVLLDVIRAPARNIASHLAAAKRVLTAASSTPPAVRLITASITAREFADHVAEERDRLTAFLRDLQTRAEQEREARLAFGLPGSNPAFLPSPLP